MASRSAKYQNWGKTYKAMSQALLGSGKALNSIATVELQEVAHKFLKEEDAMWPHNSFISKGTVVTNLFGGDAMHPWYSGQLHDSVAVRIMQGNRIVSVQYMQPSPATGAPQHTEKIKNIIGADWAREIAERHGARYLLPGVQVQLIVGVPYAEKVNESTRHYGFADELANELFSRVNQWVYSGGLVRPTIVADDKTVRVVNKSNVRKV